MNDSRKDSRAQVPRPNAKNGNLNLILQIMTKQVGPQKPILRMEEPGRHFRNYPSPALVASMLCRCDGDPSLKDAFMIGTLIFHTGILSGELRSLLWPSAYSGKAEITIRESGNAAHAKARCRRSRRSEEWALGFP